MVRRVEAMPHVQADREHIRAELGEVAGPVPVAVGGWRVKHAREAMGWVKPVPKPKPVKVPPPPKPRPPIDGRDERIRAAIQRLRASRGRTA
jgi:hypothetical protein